MADWEGQLLAQVLEYEEHVARRPLQSVAPMYGMELQPGNDQPASVCACVGGRGCTGRKKVVIFSCNILGVDFRKESLYAPT